MIRSELVTSVTVADLVIKGERLLRPSASSRLDAELLLSHVRGCDRTAIYRDPDAPVTPEERERFAELTTARVAGQPVAQLVGRAEFWSLSFVVDENVLVPRPETEILVETALDLLPRAGNPVLADLGTGSGAVAIVLALERPAATVIATDLSALALEVAQRNCGAHRADRVLLLRANWMSALANSEFDLIASNPPYVSSNDPLLSNSDIRFEPLRALAAGSDGLADMRLIIEQAPRQLKQGGYLLVEHGYNQALTVRQLFSERGFQQITTIRDLAGIDRVTYGRK